MNLMPSTGLMAPANERALRAGMPATGAKSLGTDILNAAAGLLGPIGALFTGGANNDSAEELAQLQLQQAQIAAQASAERNATLVKVTSMVAGAGLLALALYLILK